MSVSEQTRKRLANQAAILRCIREHGALSRSRISDLCDIRKASVTHICRELVDRGALEELQPGFYRSEVRLSDSFWKALAVQLSPSEITAVSVDHCGNINQRWTRKTGRRTRPEAILPLIAELICEALRSDDAYVGIGISIPGIVDVDKGRCLSAVNLGDWREVALVGNLTEALPQSAPGIAIENDAMAGLIANHWFQELEANPADSIYIALGQGVGCAQMSGGKPVRGQHFAAGEIGCLPAGNEGRKCSCGKVDCLQTYCGEEGLRQSLVKGSPALASYSLGEIGAIAKGDKRVRSQLEKALEPLVGKVGTIVALSDPTSLIVVSDEPELAKVVPSIFRSGLQRILGWSNDDFIPVTCGIPPGRACLLGAAASVFDLAFQSESLRVQ
ncbi:ROK family transcriptional regulator [Verrucomicrobiales bacterium BCK34]|nr:ROK family transcriptional regulator [Verrucomicrobiales bacterium BCK34]